MRTFRSALTGLKFPQAWNKSCGTAYVAVIDNGIELAHPSFPVPASSLRSHLSKDCTQSAGGDPINTSDCRTHGVSFEGFAGGVPYAATASINELLKQPGDVRGHGTHVAGILSAAPSAVRRAFRPTRRRDACATNEPRRRRTRDYFKTPPSDSSRNSSSEMPSAENTCCWTSGRSFRISL